MPNDPVPARPPRIARLAFGELASGSADDLAPGADCDTLLVEELRTERLALTDALLVHTRLAGVVAAQADLRGSRWNEVSLERVDLPVVRAARSQWREVQISGRLGSIEAYESSWRTVSFTGSKLTYLNLRGAELADVSFTDCLIEELDLLEATAARVAFPGCRIGRLAVHGGDLADIDLRGALIGRIDGVRHLAGCTVDTAQLTALAPLLAADLGIAVAD